MKKLRLVMMGGGLNSAIGYTHWVAARMDGLFDVIGGQFSRDSETNKRTAERYGINKVLNTAEECIDFSKHNADAVVILTPIPDHADLICMALERHVPIICEKPLTSNVSDAMRIEKSVRETEGFLRITYNYTGYPMLREMRRLIRTQTIGELTQFHLCMPQQGYICRDAKGQARKPQAWRLVEGDIATVSLDLGSHLHEIFYYLTGLHPHSLVADAASLGCFPDVIDTVSSLCRYGVDGKVLGTYQYGKAALGSENGLSVSIYGTRGTLSWRQEDAERLIWYQLDGLTHILTRGCAECVVANEPRYNRFKAGHPDGFIEAFANVYADIYQELSAFLVGKAFHSVEAYSSDYGLENIRFLSAISESCHKHVWISC